MSNLGCFDSLRKLEWIIIWNEWSILLEYENPHQPGKKKSDNGWRNDEFVTSLSYLLMQHRGYCGLVGMDSFNHCIMSKLESKELNMYSLCPEKNAILTHYHGLYLKFDKL